MSENRKKVPKKSADIKKNKNAFLIKLAAANEAVYRFHYGLGMQALRRLHRTRRALVTATAPLRRRLTLLWRRTVTRRVRRLGRAWKFFLAGFPAAGRELAAAAKHGVFSVFPCFGSLVVRAYRRHRSQLT